MTAIPEPTDWLTDELMQRAAKLIQDIDGIASQGSVYVVSRALYEAEKRGREEAAKIVDNIGAEIRNQARNPSETQLGKSMEMVADAIRKAATQ